MAVAVDRDAMDLAVPGADRRLEIIDDVVEIDLLHHPVGHFRQQILDAHVAFERRAHFDDVEIDGAGGDRLLQARVVVGLGEIDPLDLGAGIGLPRREEAAEQEVVQVLVVEPHEGELDALELAGLDILLGRAEAEFADLLPVGVGRRTVAGAGNLHDLRDDAVGGVGRRARKAERPPAATRGGAAPPETAAAGLHRHQLFVDLDAHCVFLHRLGSCGHACVPAAVGALLANAANPLTAARVRYGVAKSIAWLSAVKDLAHRATDAVASHSRAERAAEASRRRLRIPFAAPMRAAIDGFGYSAIISDVSPTPA